MIRTLLVLVATLLLPLGTAAAQDKFKVAVGQIEIWGGIAPVLGMKSGIFQKHGLSVESFGTQGAGETLQAVISGAADIGINVGFAGVMRAYQKGAPLRVLGANFTGVGDTYWYVRADSPIKKLQDATDHTTIAYSTSGSTTNNTVLKFGEELGIKGIPTSTGGLPGTLTAVMSGQVDIGWASAPFGLKEAKEGKIRILTTGNILPSVRNQTIRVEMVNANVLRDRHAAVQRFVQAYREVLDWMYSDPKAVQMYADETKISLALAEETVKTYQPKESRQFDHIKEIDSVMADAVKLKFLDRPLTKAQLADFIQILPR